MNKQQIVSRDEWVDARRRLLIKEKDLQHLRDALAQERRDLPWQRVDKQYLFDGAAGKETLTQLFAGKSQLIVYHFMFAPEWEVGCKSCSFWADNFNGIIPHLMARDVGFAAISRAPIAKLLAFEARLKWTFKWVSSGETDFNYDYHVSFRPEELAHGTAAHNFAPFKGSGSDMPGFSVFTRDPAGTVFHTYSTYGRGIDPMNVAYQLLDIVPKGRDEAGLPHPMAWVKLHDLYSAA